MSYEAAIGQIDQILQWQQQIADPASAAQSSASSTDSSSSTSAASEEFAAALAEAQGSAADEAIGTDSTGTGDLSSLLGSDDGDLLTGGDSQLLSLLSSLSPNSSTTGISGTPATGSTAVDTAYSSGTSSTSTDGYATATSADDPRIQSMISEADSLVGKPYVWGGGHDGWGAQSGYDCSGFVSAVLHAGGYLSSPQDTETLPTAAGIEQGPGQYVTIYDRDEAGQEGHVIISIDGQFYESGGEHGSWGGGGGVEKIGTPSAAYLATFNDVLHPAGL